MNRFVFRVLLMGLFCVAFAALTVALRAETWSAQTVVLTPSQSWEFSAGSPSGAVSQPSVLPRNSCLIVSSPCLAMWYSGGWEKCATGYAETADLSGASGWTKYSSNPIIGQTVAGFALACRAKTIVGPDGFYYIFFSVGIGAPGTSLYLAISSNGVAFTAIKQVLFSSLSPALNVPSNSYPFAIGSRWGLLYDDLVGGVWVTFLATAANLDGPFIVDGRGRVVSLQIPGGSHYGAPWVQIIDGVFHAWTLNSPTSGLPTPIYHWCSANPFSGWQRANGGNPVVSAIPSGYDQIGDPALVDGASIPNGASQMYIDNDNNSTGHTTIALVTTPGPLSVLFCP